MERSVGLQLTHLGVSNKHSIVKSPLQDTTSVPWIIIFASG